MAKKNSHVEIIGAGKRSRRKGNCNRRTTSSKLLGQGTDRATESRNDQPQGVRCFSSAPSSPERTRVAQELHDTVEQTMTGIALQLDLVSDQTEKIPEQRLPPSENCAGPDACAEAVVWTCCRSGLVVCAIRAEEQFDLTNAS